MHHLDELNIDINRLILKIHDSNFTSKSDFDSRKIHNLASRLKGVKDILVSGMARDTIRMPLITPATTVTPVGRTLQLSTDKHSTPINANCLP